MDINYHYQCTLIVQLLYDIWTAFIFSDKTVIMIAYKISAIFKQQQQSNYQFRNVILKAK